ncbi:biotin carboxylase N-terminal domain-containing protein [Ferrimicrobium sp.]|uniref:acetyl/propionyl/methylcrotonyl-CoA carboxylase subunit alpha n=1 Tax=Ferrimicrobium sp. TaxID=2926050 RepID=UPI00260A173F|nr:biotin carboxylase N-terminal domain-containing protein [Ferrimicrobium sp.]
MTLLRSVLIANRGEIASRIIRTCRRMDIATVAIFSEADENAPFVAEADSAVALHGNTPSETYLSSSAIIEAALRMHCDAVHPGYGFLSENANFARECLQAGLIFVGPSPQAIELMGSKITAKEIMAAAGVPVLPGLTVESVSDLSDEDVDRARQVVGYPLLVKAAYGGGGRGMRVVRAETELSEALEGASHEALSAFGNGTVFLEHYVDSPRHIEVQICGDTHGEVIHLFERECSIQRRYQKIIEESPSVAVTPELRSMLGDAAISAARAIDYVGAGTVEFVMGADGRFFFLEVNTRLQVEHPVTELVTGLDLVELQMLVASGGHLPEQVHTVSLHGHAIEARLYAEDVEEGFLPTSGTVDRFLVPALPGIRVDSGIAEGSEVGVHYDSMLAKVIAYGATREDARRTLARALAETRLHGVISNRELLVAILRDEDFRSGTIDTGFLARKDPIALMAGQRTPGVRALHTLCASLASQAERREQARVLTTLPSGWRNVPNGPQQVTYRVDGEAVTVSYRVKGRSVAAEIDGAPFPMVELYSQAPTRVDLAVDGVRQSIEVHRVGETLYVDGATEGTVLREVRRFGESESSVAPGSLLAPMPGTVIRIAARQGQWVQAGAAVMVLEAMKMEHTIIAPHDGTVEELCVEVGEAVGTGRVLVILKEDT